MKLGDKIQQLRKASGISQEQLAEQLDVSRQSVSKWELNDAIPDVSKIVMISELFSVSIDELLKDSHSIGAAIPEGSNGNLTSIVEITKLNLAHRQITMGFWTVVTGLIMFVVELMFLPILGTMQKTHVNGQGFYLDFMKYAKVQPMPAIFTVTAILVLIGIAFLLKGYIYKIRHAEK